MNKGIVRSPIEGQKYRIYFSKNQYEEFIYEGFGPSMSSRWRHVASGDVISDLPPHIGYEKVQS